MDYLTLLLHTYINEKEIFLEVIQNRQIQFEKEQSISKKEFYFNCRKVIETLKKQIDDRFYKRQNELCQIIDLKDAKGEPIENIEKDLNTIHKNQFPINLLHLTADKFRGHLYLNDVKFIETSLNELQYISEVEKTQVRNKLLPRWLYYKVEHEVIDIAYKEMVLDFEDVQKYEALIKQMIRISEKIFIEQIAPLDRKEFITVINDQYNNYNLKCSDMTDWVNTTYKLITKGLPKTQINLQSKSEFLDWYKEKVKSITIEAPQQTEAVVPDVNFEFENNFDRVNNTAVYDFFKTKLVDKKYLTIDNLHSYLKVAFENPKQPPLTKFSFEKKYLIKDIRKIFYDYFTIINTEKYNTQDRYIKLLTDYFQGFDFEKIKNNFNK